MRAGLITAAATAAILAAGCETVRDPMRHSRNSGTAVNASITDAVSDAEAVCARLEELHDAASKADATRYFRCFAPGAVFLGTDATERWTLAEFKAYALPHFQKGKGWTYIPRPNGRHVELREDVAWFDEALDNAVYGECRGSGVLVKIDNDWKITQYNLTVPIPNDLLKSVAGMIREHSAKAGAPAPAPAGK